MGSTAGVSHWLHLAASSGLNTRQGAVLAWQLPKRRSCISARACARHARTATHLLTRSFLRPARSMMDAAMMVPTTAPRACVHRAQSLASLKASPVGPCMQASWGTTVPPGLWHGRLAAAGACIMAGVRTVHGPLQHRTTHRW